MTELTHILIVGMVLVGFHPDFVPGSYSWGTLASVSR